MIETASAPAPRVLIAQGELAGLTDRGIHNFRGIPYAQPPVGALRWAPPQPPTGWVGARDATAFGDVAPQAVRMGSDFQTDGESEDCLYLNVSTRTLDAQARQPVMVWIHGGGNLYGAASDPLYDPAALAGHGVTLVTFNYRLGVFGFLAHPVFGANFAVLDYVAALRWVRENITQFGGDPDNVTIFGQSAGAVAVRTLLSCPPAAGLFHRGIIQSAGFEAKATGEWWSRETNEAAATELFGALGSMDPDILRAVPTDQVMASAAALSGAKDRAGFVRTPAQLVWMPVVDDEVVVGDGYPAWGRDVPVMLGTVENESRFFLRPERKAEFDRPLLERMTQSLAGPAATDVMRWFDESGLDPYSALDALVTTIVFTEPANRTIDAFSVLERDFFAYHFERSAPGAVASLFLAAHASELPYIFGRLAYAGETPYLFGKLARDGWYNATDHSLAEALQEAWVAFARTGIPQSGGEVWPRYRAELPQRTIIGDTIRAEVITQTPLAHLIESSRDGAPPRSWLGGAIVKTSP